jgi:PAS domain S-box-containing protein
MQSTAPERSPAPVSVRSLLIRMMLACFLPGLAAVGFYVVRQYQDGRAQLASTTIQTARAMAQAVDAQLAQGEVLARALATSGSLARRDFAAFHQRALRVAGDAPFVQSVHIYERDGAPRVNSRLPFGQAMPRRINLTQIESVFATGRPARPELIDSPLSHQPVISLMVPVFSGARVEYALAMGISPDVFSRILATQSLAPEWVAGILDGAGTIVARTHAAETFVGRRAGPAMLQQLALAPEGSFDLTTLEGIPTVAPYSRSAWSGWSVAIGIPRAALEAQLRHSLLVLFGCACLIMGLSMGAVWFFGARFAHASVALRAQALAESHAALLSREAELADAQRIAKIGSWSWDLQTDQTWSSLGTQRIFGLAELPPFAQQDGLLFSHATWQVLNQAQQTMRQTGQAWNLELPALRADGAPLWLNTRAEPVRDAGGQVTGMRGMVQDLTERKRAETALQQSAMRYRTLVEDSPEAIVVQRNGVILFANTACQKMFGAGAASDLMGRSMLDFVHPDFHQSTRERMQSIALPGELAPLTGLKFIRLDGALMDGEAQSTAMLFDGEPAIRIYLRDTTAHKRQTRELATLRGEMQTMMEWQVARHTVAALAHEINQPLASLAVLCEAARRMLVRDGLSGDAGARRSPRLEQALHSMVGETERAGVVIRQLMRSVQQPDVTLQPTAVRALLHEAAQMLLGEGGFDGQIHISCPDRLLPIKANQLQITKVLLNLLGNAAQAMQSARVVRGDIWLSATLEHKGTMVDISVRDAGPGIAANRSTEIFQAFVSTKPEGLGMGLAISRALVEAHGGKLWLDAKAGPGATFHFTLPT